MPASTYQKYILNRSQVNLKIEYVQHIYKHNNDLFILYKIRYEMTQEHLFKYNFLVFTINIFTWTNAPPAPSV